MFMLLMLERVGVLAVNPPIFPAKTLNYTVLVFKMCFSKTRVPPRGDGGVRGFAEAMSGVAIFKVIEVF